MKAPFNVPAPVIVNDTADDAAFEPAEAADQDGVPLAENVGAFVEPASVQPACDAIVSAALIAVNETEEIKPINGPT